MVVGVVVGVGGGGGGGRCDGGRCDGGRWWWLVWWSVVVGGGASCMRVNTAVKVVPTSDRLWDADVPLRPRLWPPRKNSCLPAGSTYHTNCSFLLQTKD